jgi:hypothetical protein
VPYVERNPQNSSGGAGNYPDVVLGDWRDILLVSVVGFMGTSALGCLKEPV